MCFRWLREVISRPSTYICSGLRVPVLWKLSETTSFTRGRFGDEICAGILARRMDEPNYVVQYWSPPLVAFRVLVLPADPLLHSGPCTATETILTAVGKFRGREITSAIRPNDVFFMGRRRDSSPQHLHLLAIRSSAHQQSYLLSSVDPVLYCDTNGPTHAPTVLSLAPSPASVCASSLGPLRVVRFLLSCFAERCIHYCLCATSAALLFASFIMLRVMICFLCTLVLPIMPSNSKWPAVLTTSQYFNLLVPRVGRSCAKTNAD
jgi:hypothetical protein